MEFFLLGAGLACGLVLSVALERLGLRDDLAAPILALAGAGATAMLNGGDPSSPPAAAGPTEDLLPLLAMVLLHAAGRAFGLGLRGSGFGASSLSAALRGALRVFFLGGIAHLYLTATGGIAGASAPTAYVLGCVWTIAQLPSRRPVSGTESDAAAGESLGPLWGTFLGLTVLTALLPGGLALPASSPMALDARGEPSAPLTMLVAVAVAGALAVLGAVIDRLRSTAADGWHAPLAVCLAGWALSPWLGNGILLAGFLSGAIRSTLLSSATPAAPDRTDLPAHDHDLGPNGRMQRLASLAIAWVVGHRHPELLSWTGAAAALPLWLGAVAVQTLIHSAGALVAAPSGPPEPAPRPHRRHIAQAWLASWQLLPGVLAMACLTMATARSAPPSPPVDADLPALAAAPLGLRFILLAMVLQGGALALRAQLQRRRDAQKSPPGPWEELDARWISLQAATAALDRLRRESRVPETAIDALAASIDDERRKLEIEFLDLERRLPQALELRWRQLRRVVLHEVRGALELARADGRLSPATVDRMLREIARSWLLADTRPLSELLRQPRPVDKPSTAGGAEA